MSSNIVEIYTDGACSGNPGPGGWGALLINGECIKEIYGSDPDTTNNKMEVVAAIKALQNITKECEIRIYTDSIYLRDGMEKWVDKWKKNGWRTANKQPVKNMDLWKQLDSLRKNKNIKWFWVKAHNGNVNNEKADALACKGRDIAKQGNK